MTKESDSFDNALVVAGTERQPFIVSFSEYEGSRLLDVRKYYKDKQSGELKPTRKGVALTRVQYEVLHNVFSKEEDEIEAWFSSNEDDRSKTIRSHDEHRYGAARMHIEIAEWRGLEMFKFEKKGQHAILFLNKTHPWVSKFIGLHNIAEIQDNQSDEFCMVLDLLNALFQAIALIDRRNEHASEVIDTVIGNWGIFAKRYAKED